MSLAATEATARLQSVVHLPFPRLLRRLGRNIDPARPSPLKLSFDNVRTERLRHRKEVVLGLLEATVHSRRSEGNYVGAALQGPRKTNVEL